jgi:hypothetical protein
MTDLGQPHSCLLLPALNLNYKTVQNCIFAAIQLPPDKIMDMITQQQINELSQHLASDEVEYLEEYANNILLIANSKDKAWPTDLFIVNDNSIRIVWDYPDVNAEIMVSYQNQVTVRTEGVDDNKVSIRYGLSISEIDEFIETEIPTI